MKTEQLELKHIVGYLPYGLKGQVFEYKKDHLEKRYEELTGIEKWDEENSYWAVTTKSNSRITLCSFKPILRPLSDITKEITHNGETFVPCKILFPLESFDKLTGYTSEKYAQEFIDSSNRLDICYDYNHWQKLYEWHFDFKDLIENNLAIDINTL